MQYYDAEAIVTIGLSEVYTVPVRYTIVDGEVVDDTVQEVAHVTVPQ